MERAARARVTCVDGCPVYAQVRHAVDSTLDMLLSLDSTHADIIESTVRQRVFIGLADQTGRSACSVSANLAEGDGRANALQRVTFAKIARGSLVETIDHLHSIGKLHPSYACAAMRVRDEWRTVLPVFDAWLADLAHTTALARR